jgi:two-component system phosphate regulon response regulator PhoB
MNKKILVIEDDSDIREVIRVVLNMNDYDVAGISGTDDIIESVKTHKPDLVITDYMLPGLSGGQICQLIKSNAETAHLPVILISAYHKLAIAIGNFNYDAYVKKPFDINHLIKVIKQFIK